MILDQLIFDGLALALPQPSETGRSQEFAGFGLLALSDFDCFVGARFGFFPALVWTLALKSAFLSAHSTWEELWRKKRR